MPKFNVSIWGIPSSGYVMSSECRSRMEDINITGRSRFGHQIAKSNRPPILINSILFLAPLASDASISMINLDLQRRECNVSK